MKIAMVFDGLGIGGIERVGADYARLLRGSEHEVTVVNLRPGLAEMVKEYPRECSYVTVNYPRWLAPERYAKLIKMGVVGRFLYPCLYAGSGVLSMAHKCVCKMGGVAFRKEYDVAIAFSGHYNDLTFVAERFVKATHRLAWLHGNIMGYAIISDGFLNLYRKIKNLIVLDDDYQDDVLVRNPQMQLNIHKLYNPSFILTRDVDETVVAELKMKYGHYLMMVGRLDADKDQMTLIKAVEHIITKYQFREKLLLVGDGTRREQLERYVKERGLQEQVIFVGNRHDVQNYYRAAHLFAHSSPAEGLPTTLIEALMFGVPIVSTKSQPGVEEVLENGKYGAIVPVGDWEKLGEAVYALYQDEKMYRHYQQLSQDRADAFMPATIQSKIQEILEDLST